jgi:hypothetical protein
MYVYILRDKETGLKSYEISRFGIVHTETRDIMFRVSVSDMIAAHRMVDLLNLDMLTFGDIGNGFVDKSVYYDVLDSRNRTLQIMDSLQTKLEFQASIIRQDKARIAELSERMSAIEKFLERIMNGLAVLAAIRKTHSDKNRVLRLVVKSIHDRYWDKPQEDEIPF